MPAPIQRRQMVKGDEVKKFEEGKVYIVEFWANWCGPCIVMMPHISELQQQFKDIGVDRHWFHQKRWHNSLEKVNDFVNLRASKYTFAYADGDEVYPNGCPLRVTRHFHAALSLIKRASWLTSGHRCIWMAFCQKVMDGSWRPKKALNSLKSTTQSFSEMMKLLPETTLRRSENSSRDRSKYPWFKNIPYGVASRLMHAGSCEEV